MEERILHLRPPVWLPLLVALIVGGAYVAGKRVETRDREPVLITVSGEGKVFAVPDIAELSFGVQTGRQKTAELAMQVLQKDLKAALDAVKKLGIPDTDIRTESLWLNPAFDWVDGRQIPRGFEASQSLSVKVRDLGKIGEALTAATAAGANQVGGVSFTIDDPEALRAEARAKAIVQARAKAETLAAQLGRQIKKLRNFSEGGGFGPPVPMMRGMAVDGFGGAMEELPVPSGEQEVRLEVTLTYELK